MKGDFSRRTFRARDHYSGVLMQQGRPVLDADLNEQASILLHQLRTTTADLIGWHGTPSAGSSAPGSGGFMISIRDGRPLVGPGHYYVDGILAENETTSLCEVQPGTPTSLESLSGSFSKWVALLDVWEREVTAAQDPRLVEPALGGGDTAIRRQVVWRAWVVPWSGKELDLSSQSDLREALGLRPEERAGTLRARVAAGDTDQESELIPPQDGYRGFDNRLYRVEIHEPGTGWYKWSRHNGSDAFQIMLCEGSRVCIHPKPASEGQRLREGELVEAFDDIDVFAQRGGTLTRVASVDEAGTDIELVEPVSVRLDRRPVLRRWDGTGHVTADADAQQPVGAAGGWIDLEDGIQIDFGAGQRFTGDYWLIPARPNAEGGRIEWPTDGHLPAPLHPFGVRHHYAPLALVDEQVTDLRRLFTPLADG
jgi:hypothetical protein